MRLRSEIREQLELVSSAAEGGIRDLAGRLDGLAAGIVRAGQDNLEKHEFALRKIEECWAEVGKLKE